MQKPTIGRVVHYHDEGGPYAAIITEVGKDEWAREVVELVTFGRNSVYFQHAVIFGGEAPEAGTWSWPPIVGGAK